MLLSSFFSFTLVTTNLMLCLCWGWETGASLETAVAGDWSIGGEDDCDLYLLNEDIDDDFWVLNEEMEADLCTSVECVRAMDSPWLSSESLPDSLYESEDDILCISVPAGQSVKKTIKVDLRLLSNFNTVFEIRRHFLLWFIDTIGAVVVIIRHNTCVDIFNGFSKLHKI